LVTNFEMQVLPVPLGPVTMAVSADSLFVMGSRTLERSLTCVAMFYLHKHRHVRRHGNAVHHVELGWVEDPG
jgi:hypothetical protein